MVESSSSNNNDKNDGNNTNNHNHTSNHTNSDSDNDNASRSKNCGYKGKSTTRAWAALPPEVLRMVVTHLLLEVSAAAPLPHSWMRREDWQSRMVYVVVRDAAAIEAVMRVAPSWAAASEYQILF